MTVCIATNNYPPAIGGIPNYYQYLAEILNSFGHRVIILTIDDAGGDIPDAIENKGPFTKVTLRATYIKNLRFYKKYFRPGSYAAYQWISMGYAMRAWLLKNISAHSIDIIETTDFGGAGIFLVDDSLPPLIVVGHSSATQISERSYMKNDDHLQVIKQLEYLSFKYCDGIVAHSPMNQQDLGKVTGRSIYFARAPWIIQKRSPSFSPEIKIEQVVVNSLQMIKGAEIMAAAIRLAIKKESSLKIHWIGGDSYTAPHGEKVSTFLGREYADIWDKNFIWLGEKEHQAVLDIVSQAKAAIIPSCWDTFNYFALEAVIFEKPLIITENTGASYLFTNEKNTWIIPSGFPEKLAEALLEQALLSKEGIRDSNRNKDKIMTYFSPSNIMKDREVLYNACQTNRNKNGTHPVESLSFINNYTTTFRKYYYRARKNLKNIIKGGN